MHRKTGILMVGFVLSLGATAQRIAAFSLVFATPASGSVFSEAPTRIRLIFSERLDPAKGEVSLVTPDRRAINLTAAIDPHLVDAIIARVPPLQPGAYHVQYRVVSARGASLSGSYAFAFGSASSLPSADDSSSVGAPDDFLTRSGLSPSVLRGVALLLAVALVVLIWIRYRSRSTL
jgi:methionine-rich copper-binding protein CopC